MIAALARVAGVTRAVVVRLRRDGLAYQRHAENSAYNAHYDRPAVLATLGPVGGMHVLDAACGPGFYTKELLARGAEVTAFDASAAMLELAKANAGGRAARIDRAVLGEPLPYADDAFDAIVCALAIHYADDRAAAFAEFFRVLRPGGAWWCRRSIRSRTGCVRAARFRCRAGDRRLEMRAGPQPVRFWREPLSSLCAAATSAGFLIERWPSRCQRTPCVNNGRKITRNSRPRPGFLILRLLKPRTLADPT